MEEKVPLIEEGKPPAAEKVSEPYPDEPLFALMYLGFMGSVGITLMFQGIPLCGALLGERFGPAAFLVLSASFYIGMFLIMWTKKGVSPFTRLHASGVCLGAIFFLTAFAEIYQVPFRLYLVLVLIGLAGFLTAVVILSANEILFGCSLRAAIAYIASMAIPGLVMLPLKMLIQFGLDRAFPDSLEEARRPVSTLILLGLATALAFGIVPVTYWGLQASSVVKERLAQLADSDSRTDLHSKTYPQAIMDVWPHVLSLVLVELGTGAIVPGILFAWAPAEGAAWCPGGQWGYRELTLYVFGVFSMLGRPIVLLWTSAGVGAILAGAVSRLVLIPVCVLVGTGLSILNKHWIKFLLVAVLGFSEGLLVILSFAVALATQLSQRDKITVGHIMQVALLLGQLLGAGAWLGLDQIPNMAQLVTYAQECKIDSSALRIVCDDDD